MMPGNQESTVLGGLGDQATSLWVAAIDHANPDQSLFGGGGNVQSFLERQGT